MCANTLQPWSARRKTRKRPSASIWTSVHGSHNVIVEAHHRNAIVRISCFLRGAIAVEALLFLAMSMGLYGNDTELVCGCVVVEDTREVVVL